jgi:hypothetical protein
MSNQINLNITITEAVAVEVFPDNLSEAAVVMPVAMAEILGEDFRSDDEAEFLQAVLALQQEIEDVLMSDNTEDFLLPTQDDIAPIFAFYEKLEDLKAFRFGKRTLERMERRIRGDGVVAKIRLTETDKASNPAYKKCPDCLRHFMKGYLGFHMGTDICVKVKTAHNLRPSGNNKTKVSEKIYNACYDLEDLFKRAVAYKKHIEPELEAEPMEDEEEKEVRGFCVQCEEEGKFIGKEGDEWTCLDCLEREDEQYAYVVKTWVYDAETNEIEYFGLYEGADFRKSWEFESEASVAFESAIEGGEFIAIELVEIDPNSNENRETIMNGWKGSIKRGEEIIIQKWECNLTDFLEEGGETDKEAE